MDALVAAILNSQPIHKLLKAVPDISLRDRAGLTPLHHAVLAGNADAVETLLSHASRGTRPLRRGSGSPSRAAGSPWDIVTAPGPPPSRPSPLHMAAERNEQLLRIMLGHSSLVNVGASFLGIPISSRPKPELLELRDARGWSLLHYAASRANMGALRHLLHHMAGGDRVGASSAYSSGSSSGGGGTVESPRTNAGGSGRVWAGGGSGGVNATDTNGYTALHTAALLGHADCCRLLLKAGVDQSRTTAPPDVAMPIHLAASGNHTAAVETLFRHAVAQHGFRSAQAMLLRPNGACETALHVAALHGAVDAARRLLHLVFPFDTRGPLGRTAFHLAALRGNTPMLHMLIRHSTPLQRELADLEGFTAAHLAAAAGQLDALRVLAAGGCDMDARAAPAPAAPAGCEGWTPLHCAARCGDVAAIELLVCELGTDPHARDASGRTPCDLAVAVASSRPGESSSGVGSGVGSGVQNLDDGSLDAVAAEDDGGGGSGSPGGGGGAAAAMAPPPAWAPVQAVGVATAGGVAVGFLRGPSIGEGPDGGGMGGGRLHEAQALAVLQTFIRLLHKPLRKHGSSLLQSEPPSPAPSAVVSPAASEAFGLQRGPSSTAAAHAVGSGALASGGSSGRTAASSKAAGRAAARAAERAAARAKREALMVSAAAGAEARVHSATAEQLDGTVGIAAPVVDTEAARGTRHDSTGAGKVADGHAAAMGQPHSQVNGLAHSAGAVATTTQPRVVPHSPGTAPRASPFAAAGRKPPGPAGKPLETQPEPAAHASGAPTVMLTAAATGGTGPAAPGVGAPQQAAPYPHADSAGAGRATSSGVPPLAHVILVDKPSAPAPTPIRPSPFGRAPSARQVLPPPESAVVADVAASPSGLANGAAPVASAARPSPFVAATRPSPFAAATKPSPFAAAAKPSPFAAASRPSPFSPQPAAQPAAQPPGEPQATSGAIASQEPDGSPAAGPAEGAPAGAAARAAPPGATAEEAAAHHAPLPPPAEAGPRTAPVDIPAAATAATHSPHPGATPFATATAVAVADATAPGSLLATVPSIGSGSAEEDSAAPSAQASSTPASDSYFLSAINSPYGFSALNRAILLQRHALVEALLTTLPGAGGAATALTLPSPSPVPGFGRSGVARKPSLPARQSSANLGAAQGKSSSQGKAGQLSPSASAAGPLAGEPGGARRGLPNRQTLSGAVSRLKRPPSHPRDLQQQAQPQLQRGALPPLPPQQPSPTPPQPQPDGSAALGAGDGPGAAPPPGASGQAAAQADAGSSSSPLPPLLPMCTHNGSLMSTGLAVLHNPAAPVPGVLGWDEGSDTFRTHQANHASRVWLHWPGTPDPATGWLLAEMVLVDAGTSGGHVWLGLGPAPETLPAISSASASTASLAAAAGPPAAAPPPLGRAPTTSPAALLPGVGPLAPAGTAAAVAAAQCPVMNHPSTHVVCVRDGQAFRGGVLTSDLGGGARLEARVGDVVGLFWNRLGRAVAFTLNGKYCGRLAGLPTEDNLTPIVGLQCSAFSFRWRCVSNGVVAGNGTPGAGGSGRVAGNIDGLMIREQMINEDPETPWLCKEPSMTSLHFAAWAGNTRVLPQLVRSKAFAPDELDADGWTSLHFAALAGQLEVVRALLELGGQPDVKSKCGQTPALLAAKYGRSPDHVAIVRLLADLGAELGIRDPRGRTLLMLAARAGNLAMCQLLLERGLDASATDNQEREAVQFAGQHGAIFRLLRNAQDAQRAGARKARARRREQELQEEQQQQQQQRQELQRLTQQGDAAAAAPAGPSSADPPPLPVPAAVAEPVAGPRAATAMSSCTDSDLAAEGGSVGEGEGGSEGDGRGRDADTRHLPQLAERWRVGAGQLVRGRLIEQGAFGAVFEGTWCSARVAIKQVLRRRRGSGGGGGADGGGGEQEREAEREAASLQREVAILAALPPHERIARMLGSVELPGEGTCLVMAYYPHTLQGVMQSERLRRSWLTPARRASIARQLAEGLAFLHGLPGPRIIHRDLKPNNVLLEAPPSLGVKICDFGLARLLMSNDVQSSSAAGHAFWMAPELLRALSYDEKVDVYSYGVILYQLAYWVDDQLYGGLNKAQVDFQVVHGILRLQDRLPGGIDPGVQSVVRDCLDEDPRARPSMAQVLQRLAAVRELPQPQHANPQAVPLPAAAPGAAAGAGAAFGAEAGNAAHAAGRQAQSPQHQHPNQHHHNHHQQLPQLGAGAAAVGRSPDGHHAGHTGG